MRAALLAFVAVLAASPCLAAEAGTPDARAAAIFHEVMSPYCPQLLLADCRSDAADALRADVRRALARGASDTAIREDLARRFGERILAAPPRRGFGLIAWLTPPAVLLGATLLLLARLGSRPAPADARAGACQPTPAQRARLDAELERA